MQPEYHNAEDWLKFFHRLYRHMDEYEGTTGLNMFFYAFPIKLQAHILQFPDEPLSYQVFNKL